MSVSITTASGNERELARVELLHDLRRRFDVRRFEYTDVVVVEEGVIPHSHPVLTMNTRDTSEVEVLSTYLHEQLHWWSLQCPGVVDGRDETVFEQIGTRYAPLPVGLPDGCDSELSALIHHHVCWLELEALASLIGDEDALACVAGLSHYRTVYRNVITDRVVLTELFEAAGMGLPPSSQP